MNLDSTSNAASTCSKCNIPVRSRSIVLVLGPDTVLVSNLQLLSECDPRIRSLTRLSCYPLYDFVRLTRCSAFCRPRSTSPTNTVKLITSAARLLFPVLFLDSSLFCSLFFELFLRLEVDCRQIRICNTIITTAFDQGENTLHSLPFSVYVYGLKHTSADCVCNFF